MLSQGKKSPEIVEEELLHFLRGNDRVEQP